MSACGSYLHRRLRGLVRTTILSFSKPTVGLPWLLWPLWIGSLRLFAIVVHHRGCRRQRLLRRSFRPRLFAALLVGKGGDQVPSAFLQKLGVLRFAAFSVGRLPKLVGEHRLKAKLIIREDAIPLVPAVAVQANQQSRVVLSPPCRHPFQRPQRQHAIPGAELQWWQRPIGERVGDGGRIGQCLLQLGPHEQEVLDSRRHLARPFLAKLIHEGTLEALLVKAFHFLVVNTREALGPLLGSLVLRAVLTVFLVVQRLGREVAIHDVDERRAEPRELLLRERRALHEVIKGALHCFGFHGKHAVL